MNEGRASFMARPSYIGTCSTLNYMALLVRWVNKRTFTAAKGANHTAAVPMA